MTQAPAPSPPSEFGSPTPDEKNMALLAHVLGVFTWFLGALIIWLIKKDSSAYVNDQGKEALNFQLTVGIAYVAVSVAACVTLGFGAALGPIVWVGNVIFCVLAAVACSRGERFRYPFTLRLLS